MDDEKRADFDASLAADEGELERIEFERNVAPLLAQMGGVKR